jgi:hypothetical protein
VLIAVEPYGLAALFQKMKLDQKLKTALNENRLLILGTQATLIHMNKFLTSSRSMRKHAASSSVTCRTVFGAFLLKFSASRRLPVAGGDSGAEADFDVHAPQRAGRLSAG